MRRRILGGMLGFFLAGASPLLARAQTSLPPLRIAVHPYASTLALIAMHRPLTQYLSARLGRPVEFYTAPNFEAFVESLQAGEYDIAIAPPHFAVLAMDDQYWPVLHYAARLEPILVVRNDSSLQRIEDLRGKRIAMADRSALIRLASVKWLADQGLRSERDYSIVERPSHAASVSSALAGDVDAGLSTASALRQMPENVRQRVRSLPLPLSLPHLFTLLHRRNGEALRRQLRSVLMDFQETPEGQKFLLESGFKGYDEISDADIKAVRPYAELYRRTLAGGR